MVTLRTLADWMRALSRMINRISPVDVSAEFKERKSSNEKKQSEKTSNDRYYEQKYDQSKSGYLHLHKGTTPPTIADLKSKCVVCDSGCKSLEDCSMFEQFDVDQRWNSIKSHNLCRRCLKRHRRNCEMSKMCGINGCVFKHHNLLHKDKAQPRKAAQSDSRSKNANNNNQTVKTGSHNSHFQDNGDLFRIAQQPISNNLLIFGRRFNLYVNGKKNC